MMLMFAIVGLLVVSSLTEGGKQVEICDGFEEYAGNLCRLKSLRFASAGPSCFHSGRGGAFTFLSVKMLNMLKSKCCGEGCDEGHLNATLCCRERVCRGECYLVDDRPHYQTAFYYPRNVHRLRKVLASTVEGGEEILKDFNNLTTITRSHKTAYRLYERIRPHLETIEAELYPRDYDEEGH